MQIIDEDHELVSSCKKGDTDAFDTLVAKYQRRMFNVAYRMIGNYDDASEVVQDAFVSAYKNLRKFRENAKFSTWLYAIVLNLSRNRLKQVRTLRARQSFSIDDPLPTEDGQIQVELPTAEPSPHERLEQKDLQLRVQRCIDALDPEFREVLILRDIQGFSYEEIVHILKAPDGTVKSRLFRARALIADCLRSILGET